MTRFLALSAVGLFAMLFIASFGLSGDVSAACLTQEQLEESLAPIYQLIGVGGAVIAVGGAWLLVIWPFVKRRIR